MVAFGLSAIAVLLVGLVIVLGILALRGGVIRAWGRLTRAFGRSEAKPRAEASIESDIYSKAPIKPEEGGGEEEDDQESANKGADEAEPDPTIKESSDDKTRLNEVLDYLYAQSTSHVDREHLLAIAKGVAVPLHPNTTEAPVAHKETAAAQQNPSPDVNTIGDVRSGVPLANG